MGMLLRPTGTGRRILNTITNLIIVIKITNKSTTIIEIQISLLLKKCINQLILQKKSITSRFRIKERKGKVGQDHQGGSQKAVQLVHEHSRRVEQAPGVSQRVVRRVQDDNQRAEHNLKDGEEAQGLNQKVEQAQGVSLRVE